ncbi:MAG: homoserine kinase, partial [Betaproteobacteria bacterium]
TNYFADTEQGRWVLTLFERLSFEQLPFYLHLMKHLARRGIPVPDPQASPVLISRKGKNELLSGGQILHRLKDKPAALVNRLPGKSELAPTAHHCAQVGAMLARMHLAGRDFEMAQPNLRGLAWWNETVPVVLPFLSEAQRALILSELAFQNQLADSGAFKSLARGPIHADLFRDNVMFEGQGADARLCGFFDFYFAGCDSWLFDLAVCLNDWCIDLNSGARETERASAMVAAYHAQRPLSAQERRLLPAMQRAGALRFWISRLWDLHLPRQAAVLQAHDPEHFERVLRQCVERPLPLDLVATPV